MGTKYKAEDVFTPGAFPENTYVDRQDAKYEREMKEALQSKGMLVSLSGPSKSGKTVLVERVVGDDLITITGAGINDASIVWQRVLDWIGAPSETSTTTTLRGGLAAEAGASGSVGLPLLAKGEASGKVGITGGAERAKSTSVERGGLNQVVNEIGGSDFVVLVDDFHYMPRSVQEEAAKELKEAIRRGVRVVTASVPHRADDVVRGNPELRGRVVSIDLRYWDRPDLKRIGTIGFEKLNCQISATALDLFATEAAGSPQLMQQICLSACRELDIAETNAARRVFDPAEERSKSILRRAAQSVDFRTVYQVLSGGPKIRGRERTVFAFTDGTTGDVYRCILRALAVDPPRLNFSYEEILRRCSRLCTGDGPTGSAVASSCAHMAAIAEATFQRERLIDWDDEKQVLDIPEPYFSFYLRWSEYVRESR